jgi:peptidyl-prolyl cis-trans isomerase D
MLSFLRKRKRSWIITLLLSVIVVTFVLYFGGSFWNRSSSDTVVEVNGEIIRQRDLEINFQRTLDVYRDRFKGSLTPELIKNLNIKATVLDELIQRRLLLQEAQRLGLIASEDEVVHVLTSLPAFQVNGQFSKERYLDVLRYQHTTPAEFEAEMREEIAIRKLLELIRDSVHVSDSEVLDRYRSESENINLDYVRVAAGDFLDEVKVTPEELKTFYDKNRDALKEPLRVQVEYIAYPFAQFSSPAQVSDKEAEEFYQTQREKRFHEPKTIKLRHILFLAEGADKSARAGARQKAENILAEALKGKDFASLADQYSEDPSHPAGGELGWFTPGQLLPPVEQAAFKLRKGEISKVVESPLGYHILKVDDIKAENTKTFTEVKAQIVAELKHEKGKTEALRAADQDREKLISGADFSQVANERGLQLITTRLFSRGERLPEVGNAEEFYDKAFSLPVKEISPPIQGPEAYYLMRVSQRREPVVPSFDSVRARIEADLKNKKAFELALQKANDLLTQLKKEKDFTRFTSQQGLKVEETGWFPRNAVQLPKVGGLQDLKSGGIVVSRYQPLADRVYTQSDAAYLFYLKGSKEADMESFEKDKGRLRAQALSQKQSNAVQKFIDSLKARARIKFLSTELEAS